MMVFVRTNVLEATKTAKGRVKGRFHTRSECSNLIHLGSTRNIVLTIAQVEAEMKGLTLCAECKRIQTEIEGAKRALKLEQKNAPPFIEQTVTLSSLFPRKIEAWECADGTLHLDEVAACRHDLAVLRARAEVGL